MKFDASSAKDDFLKVSDLSREWNLSGQTIRGLIMSGKLPAYRPAGALFIVRRSDADAYIRRARTSVTKCIAA
jgi:excisionase family DNA binding protein